MRDRSLLASWLCHVGAWVRFVALWPCATCGSGIPTVVDHSGACRVVAHDCHIPVAVGDTLHRAFGALHFFRETYTLGSEHE